LLIILAHFSPEIQLVIKIFIYCNFLLDKKLGVGYNLKKIQKEGKMIPANITREHILEALRWLDKETPDGARPRRQSTKYDLLYEGKRYAPKEAIAIANKFANGRELNSGFGDDNETNKFLNDRGFQIVLKPWIQNKS